MHVLPCPFHPSHQLLRYMCTVSSEAHFAVMQHTRPGLKEYQVGGAAADDEASSLHRAILPTARGDVQALDALPRRLALPLLHVHLRHGRQRVRAALRPRRRAQPTDAPGGCVQRQQGCTRSHPGARRHGRAVGAASSPACLSSLPLLLLLQATCASSTWAPSTTATARTSRRPSLRRAPSRPTSAWSTRPCSPRRHAGGGGGGQRRGVLDSQARWRRRGGQRRGRGYRQTHYPSPPPFSNAACRQHAAFAAMRPGVRWTAVHEASYRALLAALRDGGLLKGVRRRRGGKELPPHRPLPLPIHSPSSGSPSTR